MNNTDSKANSRRIISLIAYIVITAVLTQLDQITKYVAESNLYMKNDIDIIKNVLTLTYLRNNGSAFGMFSGKINAFLVLTVIIVAVITYIVIRMPVTKRYLPMYIVCTMLVSGAIGNFIDRVRFGYVRDFIYFKLINFPVFNVADCYVTISVVIFIVLILFVYKENEFDFLSFKKKADKDNG
jgi:signal peptidase II